MNSTDTTNASCEDELNLYFLGNSYVFQNDLTKLTQQAFIAGGGFQKVRVEGHAKPGEHFGGHMKILQGDGPKGTAHHLHRSLVTNANRQWHWVILQNQSQVPGFIQDDPHSYQRTVQDAQNLCDYIGEYNPQTRFMFMMTWGRCKEDKRNPEIFPDFLTMQAKLTAGYLQYVAETSTVERPTFVAPCGLVYQTIYQDLKEQGLDPTFEGTLFHGLYSRDGHHPSLSGSYVAAVTIYASLTGNDAKELESWVPDGLDAQVAAQLRDAVSRTITETAATGLIRYPWQL